MNASKTKGSHLYPKYRFIVFHRLVWCCFLLITARLYYWQVIKGDSLQAVAKSQYQTVTKVFGDRGKLYSSDDYLLVGNDEFYSLFVNPQHFTEDGEATAHNLAKILTSEFERFATNSAQFNQVREETATEIATKLLNKDREWALLSAKISKTQKQQIEELNIKGLGFEKSEGRVYPEASLAAHVLGFVGKNVDGEDIGYFGAEGALNLELEGKSLTIRSDQDASGISLLPFFSSQKHSHNGRNFILTIRKDLQLMLEDHLVNGIKKYQAISGEAVIMDPKTGDILAMATWPNYEPQYYQYYSPEVFKNPLAADAYEPGSTFKVLTIAAGIDSGKITAETACTTCAQAREISGYTIKTWNDKYQAGISIRDALAKSDNTAMIFVAEQVGMDSFIDYLDKFMIGQKSGIELQEDAAFPLRSDWRHIDLATASFGQGVATTGLQMVRAVGAIANDGTMVRPRLVKQVNIDNQTITPDPDVVGHPISKQTADTVTDMMVYAAQSGEAQWTSSKSYTVAGKTGTAQIPVSGHYDEDKTIASYIGFAPAYDPQFVMLVKLREPQSSQWASETAAPLWYDIAEDLFRRLNIEPDRE